MDLYCDPDSYEFDEEKYNNNVENDYPGFKRFFECFSRFQDKINLEYLGERDIDKFLNLDNDSDSDSDDDDDDDDGIDSNEIEAILCGCEDSESDSDSD